MRPARSPTGSPTPAIEFDLGQFREVRRALAACDWVDVNGALMLHEDGASEAETRAYPSDGVVMPSARRMRSASARAHVAGYVLTYAAGQELCERWVRGDLERFARLLTEQVRVGELLKAS